MKKLLILSILLLFNCEDDFVVRQKEICLQFKYIVAQTTDDYGFIEKEIQQKCTKEARLYMSIKHNAGVRPAEYRLILFENSNGSLVKLKEEITDSEYLYYKQGYLINDYIEELP